MKLTNILWLNGNFVCLLLLQAHANDLVININLTLNSSTSKKISQETKKKKLFRREKKMKPWSQRLSFLIVVIFFFAGLHFSSGGRKLPSKTAMEKFHEQFRRLRPDGERMLSEVSAGEKYDQIYGVSVREVPGGPNPLHNKWYVTIFI